MRAFLADVDHDHAQYLELKAIRLNIVLSMQQFLAHSI